MMELLGMTDKEFVLNAAYALIGLGVFIVVRALMQDSQSRAAAENLESKNANSANPLVKLTRPFFNQYFLPFVRGRPYWDEKRKFYRRRIIAAGLREEFTPDEFIAFKLFLIIFFPIAAGVLKAGEFADIPGYAFYFLPIVGWFYPDIWVKGRMQKRQQQILRAMPFIVDLLALSTEAGLDFVGAIGKVVEKAAPSPLVEEFSQLLKEIKVGSSRQEALREMAARIDMSQVNSFVAILISADQMGASIGKILRQQSDAIRVERTLRAEKAGAAAAQKVMLPMVLFIVPAVFIMIFGPFILEMIYGGGGG